MSRFAVQAEGVSKCYRIGNVANPHARTFRDLMVDSARDLKERLLNRSAASPNKVDFWALRDVSFDLKEGDRLGIIGHNGSGKSTLLKVLSRITHPTEGSVKLRGRVASLLEVGTGFHQELTGRENIYLRGAILGMTRADIRRKFDDIVEFSGTAQFLETPIKHFSSGMYVRLAFSVSAHLEPDILIVDEVLAVGDADFQKKCLTKMDSVAREGRTVIFVSHSLGSVVSLCNQGLMLDHGKLAVSGPIQDVVNQYLKVGVNEETPGIFERSHFVASKDIITRVEVLDESMKPQLNFQYDAPLNLRIHTNAEVGHEFNIGIRLRNSRYEMVAHLASWIFNKTSLKGYKSGDTILVTIPALKLQEDTYFIEIVLFEPLSFSQVDGLYDFVHFNLINAKPIGSPINLTLDRKFGAVVWDNVQFETLPNKEQA